MKSSDQVTMARETVKMIGAIMTANGWLSPSGHTATDGMFTHLVGLAVGCRSVASYLRSALRRAWGSHREVIACALSEWSMYQG